MSVDSVTGTYNIMLHSFYHICSVMVSVLDFEPRSRQTKDYEIGIYYHAALISKNKEWYSSESW